MVVDPASVGPVVYVNTRGWLPASMVDQLETINERFDYLIMNDLPGSGLLLSRYTLWASRLAMRHNA